MPTVPMPKRFVVTGTSGAGETAIAKQIARILGVPHIEFDAYRHGPNWSETPADAFRDQLGEALRGDAWGDDGNYSIARDVVWPGPRRWYGWTTRLHLVMWRLFWRTMRRGVLRKSYGTVAMRHFVTRDSLFLWALRSHWLRRRTMPAAFAQPDHSHLDVVHLRSPKTTREWIRTLMTRR